METTNVFMPTGMNCNNQEAILTDVDNKRITNCSSTCDSINNINISSYAVEISLYVQYLQGYKVNLRSTNNNTQSGGGVQTSCVYMFLVDAQTQVLIGVNKNFSEAVQTHVPAVLEWVVQYNTTQLGLAPDNYKNSYPCLLWSLAYSSFSDSKCVVIQSLQCICNFPFLGNAYFPKGLATFQSVIGLKDAVGPVTGPVSIIRTVQ
ncbi:unnamed protein product [Camellia sinensis]